MNDDEEQDDCLLLAHNRFIKHLPLLQTTHVQHWRGGTAATGLSSCLPSQLGGLWERHKLPQRGLEWSPGRKRF